MSCDVDSVTERLENELCYNYKLCSFSKLSVTSSTSQLILQPFRHFTYVTVNFPTLPLLHLRDSSFYNPSFASPTTQALHLRHLESCPCCKRPQNNRKNCEAIRDVTCFKYQGVASVKGDLKYRTRHITNKSS